MIKKLNTFHLDYYSPVEDKKYEGKFTARITSFMDKTKINVRRSQILGGMYCVRDDNGMPTGRGVDEDSEVNAQMIAHLEVALIQKPDWFKLDGEGAITDDQVIYKIFDEVITFEKTFRAGVRGTAEGSAGSAQGSEGVGAAKSAQANAGNAPQKVVDGQVQAALDP